MKPPSPLSSEVQGLPKVQTLRQDFNEGQAVAAPHLRQPAPHGGFAGLEPLSPTVRGSPKPNSAAGVGRLRFRVRAWEM